MDTGRRSRTHSSTVPDRTQSDGDGELDRAMDAIQSTATDHAAGTPSSPALRIRQEWRSPVRLTLVVSTALLVLHAAYVRVGTSANADTVEFTQNLAGGFLAIGMTEDQPGFMVLSALEEGLVDVNAVQAVSRIAGARTVVKVRTPRGTANIRLRGPEVILVSDDGAVERHDVAWTVAEFNSLREAADCSHEAAVEKHRCGAPFADLRDVMSAGKIEGVPDAMQRFLNRYTRK